MAALAFANDKWLQVHLIPHTHDDVGWLKNVDQYYYGSQQQIDNGGVQYILDSMVRALAEKPERRFTYVEIGFFKRWWDEQDQEMRHVVRRLIKDRQLEFCNGGWAMHDEAAPYYQDMMDNMALGHAWLLKEFGVRPTVGWQIDPFGHSSANADMYAKMGLNSIFFARVDYQDKAKRLEDRSLEMLWKPDIGTGTPDGIFAHVLYQHYSWPHGYCFDIRCQDQPICDDEGLEDYNIPMKVQGFVDYINEQSKHYRSKHLMVTMGDDFNYMMAHRNFKNMDKLIHYVNEGDYGMKLFYSTPGDYVKAVYKENIQWPVKTDDFFPYADYDHAYWTGYFTSRPALKGYIRESGSLYRAFQNIVAHQTLTNQLNKSLSNYVINSLGNLKMDMGLTQHHDAVTGTEKQAVAYDYARRLARGHNDAIPHLLRLVSYSVQGATGEKIDFEYCPLRNVSVCGPYSESEALNIAVMNHHFHNITRIVEVPLNFTSASVVDEFGEKLASDLVENPFGTIDYNNSTAQYNDNKLYFRATIPAMGIRNFKVSPGSSKVSKFTKCDGDCKIHSNADLSFSKSSENWQLSKDNNTIDMEPSLKYYIGNLGDEVSGQASGAYIFRPNTTAQEPLSWNMTASSQFCGSVVCQMFLEYGTHGSQLYSLPLQDVDETFLKVQTFIDSIDISDGNGKEVVTQFKTNLLKDEAFGTDSNGMGMIRRRWNNRPTWNLNFTNEPTSCNYYPVDSSLIFEGIDARNSSIAFAVVTDRSEGGTVRSSPKDTTAELMVHRRLLHDDGRGVGEALNETEPWDTDKGLKLLTSHGLLLDSSDLERRQVEDYFNEPLQVFFGSSAATSAGAFGSSATTSA